MKMPVPFNLENLEYCPSDIDTDLDPRVLKYVKFETVKKSKKRVILYSKGFYLKAFRIDKAEALFRRDMARKEFKIARRLYSRKRTARPLLYGRCENWGLFLTEEISGLSLGAFLDTQWKALPKEEKKKLFAKFAELLKDSLELSIYQADFHLDNCFFDENSRNFLLIDFHRSKVLKKGYDERFLLKQLQKVLPPFIESKPVSRADLLLATAIFSSKFPCLRDKNKRVTIIHRAYLDMKRQWKKKFERRYDRICDSFKTGGQTVYRRKEVIGKYIKSFLKSLENELVNKEFSYGSGTNRISKQVEIIKNSRHTLCMKFFFDGKPFFVKAYRSSSHLKSFFYLFKIPRAKRAWYLSWKLNYMNITNPQPIFAVQYNNPWRPIYGMIVYPWKEWIFQKDKELNRLFSEKDAGYFARRLALFVWDMHQRGVFHGDLKITNFSWDHERNSFIVFDLDATKIRKEISKRERIKDIKVLVRSIRRKYPGAALEKIFLSNYLRFTRPFLDGLEDIESII